MKKRILAFTAILMCCAPVWAQTINDKSTSAECITFINDLLSSVEYKNYRDYQKIDAVTVQKRMMASNVQREFTHFPVDWGALSRVEFGEATSESIPFKLVFDRNFAQREIYYKGQKEYYETHFTTEFRSYFQSDKIDLNLSIDKKDQASSLETAFMRLAQLAGEISDRGAVSANADSIVQSAPTGGDYFLMDMKLISLPDWKYSFVGYGDDDFELYKENTLVFKKLDKNNKLTEEKVWVYTRLLHTIDLEGSDLVFRGNMDYAKNASRYDRPATREVFKLSLQLENPDAEPLDKEEVLRHFRFEAWRYAADLRENGFKVGQKIYNDEPL